jgi:hypothetical protein
MPARLKEISMIVLPSGPQITRDIAGEGPSAAKQAQVHDARSLLLEGTLESSFEDFWPAEIQPSDIDPSGFGH